MLFLPPDRGLGRHSLKGGEAGVAGLFDLSRSSSQRSRTNQDTDSATNDGGMRWDGRVRHCPFDWMSILHGAGAVVPVYYG